MRTKRTERINFALTPNEVKYIREAAEAMDMSVSAFIRHALQNTYSVISLAKKGD